MYFFLRFLAKVNKWGRENFLICISVLVFFTHFRLLRQKNHPLALLPHYLRLFHISWLSGGTVAAVGDCRHGDSTQSLLDRWYRGCQDAGGFWEWGGFRSRACKHVFTSNPTTNSYISLCSFPSISFLFSFSWNSRKNPKYPLSGFNSACNSCISLIVASVLAVRVCVWKQNV